MRVLKDAGKAPALRFKWLAGAGIFLALAVGLMFFSSSRPADPARDSTTTTHTDHQFQNQATFLGNSALGSRSTLYSQEVVLARKVTDASLSFRERREAVRELGRLASPQAITLLTEAFTSRIPPPLTSIVAETLGKSGSPIALAALRGALRSTDETVAGAAIRALAARGEAEDAERLQDLLLDEETPEGVRAEAALSLGVMSGPEAFNVLARAATQIKENGLAEEIWRGLGQRTFSETEPVYLAYLNDPDIPKNSKLTALESLSEASGELAPFLLNILVDTDPDIRIAAASALALAEISPNQVQQLWHLIGTEGSPAVRARLYDALAMQDGLEPAQLLQMAQSEADPGAKLSLFGLLAASTAQVSNPELLTYFDRQAVPELMEHSLGNVPYEQRLNSIIALGRAGTPEAVQALEKLASALEDPKLRETAKTAANLRQKR